MSEIIWVLIGIGSALIVALIIYFVQIYIKIHIHKNKIKNVLKQIQNQVNIKYDLLKEYIEINKENMSEDKYVDAYNKINSYKQFNGIDVEELKDFNAFCSYYMNSFDDNLLINQCKEAESKINYIKEYYNELVCFFNRYKSNKINSFISKTFDIDDERLY